MANRLPTGPRSIQARMRSLSNLRNVGKKIFFDKEYSDQLWEDGMDYTTKRRKRQARKQVNEHKRQIKQHLQSGNPNPEKLRAWEDTQQGLEDSNLIVQQENRRLGIPEKPEPRFVKHKPLSNPRRYVVANFSAGYVPCGKPVKDWLPPNPKTYY